MEEVVLMGCCWRSRAGTLKVISRRGLWRRMAGSRHQGLTQEVLMKYPESCSGGESNGPQSCLHPVPQNPRTRYLTWSDGLCRVGKVKGR